MKFLFFGDSITEAGRDLGNMTDLGTGYLKILVSKLRPHYPDTPMTFLNCGVGGERTTELLKRVESDVVAQKPDCVILQVGINDAWRYFATGEETTEKQFQANYEAIVDRILTSGAKLILVQPFVLNMDDKGRFRPYVNAYNAVIRKIAKERKLAVVPIDEIFTGVTQDIAPSQFTTDGVHPTHRGCRYIADAIIKELKKVI